MARSECGSRRSFLKILGLLLGCQYFGAEAFSADRTSPQTKIASPEYKLPTWTGDEPLLGHRLRDRELPALPEKAEKKVDFVIVGGGVAGLTAAYGLKDEDFLLLEQYTDFGGHSRGSSYQGIDYSYGAACVGAVDGIYGETYAALALDPILLPPERYEFYFNGTWFVGAEGDPTKPVYKEFAQLLQDSRPVWKALPHNPDPREMSSADLQKLDAQPFFSCLTGYSSEFIALIESYCCSSFGGKLSQLSALAGYLLLQNLVTPTHAFKGGNPAIARALFSKVSGAGSGRCLANAFVWKIEIKEGGASVVYSLADGSSHRVDCKHVIIATPPLVASRQLVHVPDLVRAQLFGFKYCSYLVANMLMKEKLFKGKYDSFVSPPFSFADLIVAETPYLMTNSYEPEMGSVLTIYQPYPGGSEGRTLLLEGNREKFASSLSNQLDTLVPGFGKSVDEIVLTRWGHAMAVVGPKYFDRLAKLQSMQTDAAYTLAHSSIYGCPNAESAIRAGKTAALRAMKLAANPGKVVK